MNFKKRVNGSWTDTSHYIHNTSTDTITTLPAVIYPTDTTATVGLKGQTLQSSIPSPTSPVMPQECGDLEENVAIIDNRSDTITNSYYKDIRLSDELPAGTYTISFTMDSKTGNAYASSLGRGNTTTYQADVSNYSIYDTPANINKTITLNSNACIWARFLRSATPATFSYNISEIAIVSGDKPYGQYKIPISSANTTTSIYLGEVPTTRKIKKFVLTGEETFFRDKERTDSWRFYSNPLVPGNSNVSICSHFEYIGTNGVNNTDNIGFSLFSATQFGCRCPKSIANTVAEFKAWLAAQYAAGTPVTVWYVLAEPTTGIVNEPLMKIGEYADTVSGITIPTITGADSFDVLTTLKPSEVELTYTGWHDASVKEWDGSQWG